MADLYTLALVVSVVFGAPAPPSIIKEVALVSQLQFHDCIGLAARYLALPYTAPALGAYAYEAPMQITTGLTCLPDRVLNTGG